MKIQVKFLSIVLAAAVCVSLTACNGTSEGTNSGISSEVGTNSSNSSSDITNGLFDNTPDAEPPEDAEYPDYSMFNGLWKGDGNNLYLLFDYGSWTYSDDGYTLDQGYTQYDANGDAKLCSIVEGPINGSYMTIDGDRINVNTIGDFNYFDGRNGVWERDYGNNWDGYEFVDFTPFVGLWQGAETNQYAGAYLKIDTRGNWTLTKDDEEIDRGYLKFDDEEELCICAFSDIGGPIYGGSLSNSDGDLLIGGAGTFVRIS